MLPVFFIIPIAIVLFFVLVAVFQWLWNITMPQVFDLRTITYWQALRILIIAGILFGGSHFPELNLKM